MLPPKENPPKKPAASDWRQRRGTSISLGSIGQSALRANADGRPPLLAPRPAAPSQPTPNQPQKPAGGSPAVSRAFMSGSLVPPRPMGARAAPQPPQAPTRPQTPPQTLPPARAANPAPAANPAVARAAPQPLPTPATAPARPQAPTPPSARSAQPAPAPQPKTEARPATTPARGIIPQPPAKPAPEPAPTPKVEPEVAAAVSAPRRTARTVREFNAAVAADARGPAPAAAPGLFNRRNAAIAAAALVVVAGGAAGAWWMTRPKTPSFTATAVTVAPPAANASVATNSVSEPSVSTSAVTEAPSDAATDAPAVIAERTAGPPANFGALAPRGAPVGGPAARAGRVVLAPLPDTPDLATGSRAAEAAPEPAPAPPPPIRLPSSDEPFSTNPANPDGGG